MRSERIKSLLTGRDQVGNCPGLAWYDADADRRISHDLLSHAHQTEVNGLEAPPPAIGLALLERRD